MAAAAAAFCVTITFYNFDSFVSSGGGLDLRDFCCGIQTLVESRVCECVNTRAEEILLLVVVVVVFWRRNICTFK